LGYPAIQLARQDAIGRQSRRNADDLDQDLAGTVVESLAGHHGGQVPSPLLPPSAGLCPGGAD
jgi:hypothetical protein